MKVNYISTEAANRIEYLQTGKVDVILANFTVTPERAEEVDFAKQNPGYTVGIPSLGSRYPCGTLCAAGVLFCRKTFEKPQDLCYSKTRNRNEPPRRLPRQ